ncbi:MAG TPA: amino acid adenylation domain-containing protein [Pyrinomonadaceae bacterium]|nr:amino acid adenylation domain-containing protein [Pyrinomonadaceae bacterium]
MPFCGSTLIDLLRFRSLNEPTLTAYRFLADDESEPSSITYGALDLRARAVAALLQNRGLQGERVLLLYPPGLDFIAAFFGCLYAGAVAVPASLPQTKRGLGRFQAIASDAQAAAALTTRQVLSRIEPFECLTIFTSDDLSQDEAAGWREPVTNGETLAYLQYTSGSTSTPKGVMVTHANVLENSAYIQHGFDHGPASVSLSWLPHFHDMGLVDGIIQPLYSGFTGLLMSPAALLQNPARWLQAITRYRVTHSGGPNFAYDLCVRRIGESQRASLDLSTWSVAYNGAEPVHHETLERFVAAFAPCGFRREAFYPAYGLAEATLKVSGGRKGAGPVYGDFNARTLVGCGRATLGAEVVIVDPELLRECSSDEVGEVWVSGPGVAAGYWNRPDETETTFNARLSRQSRRRRFLRTGDLGFVRDGELFITGRRKDLIIIRGRNHYPHDIERAVQSCHKALKPDGGAAFSVEGESEERLVVVQEIETSRKNEAPEIIETIRAVIAEEFEIQPAAVVLIRAGTLPKTSSGKIRRGACREGFLENGLSVIAEWHATDAQKSFMPPAPDELNPETVEQWLRQLLTARLGGPHIESLQPIARYGIDSLLALELTHAVETSFGVRLSSTSFLRNPTLADLTHEILAGAALHKESPAKAQRCKEEPLGNAAALCDFAPLRETFPARWAGEDSLSHGQQSLWAIQHVSPESTAYNVSVAARLRGEIDTGALQRAVSALVQRHSLLRARFPLREGAPVCIVQDDSEISFVVEDAGRWSEEELSHRLQDEAWTSFDLESGPLLRAFLFRRSSREHVLLLSAHHIVVDFWSFAVLKRELALLYDAEVAGRSAALPPVRSYSDYVRREAEMLDSAAGERLEDYWLQQLAGDLPVLDLPADRARPLVQSYRGASVSARLDQQLTVRLRQLALSHEATLFMTLLAAFQVLLYRYTGQGEILVGSPTSGRGSSEFAGTIGYFVNPLVLRAKLSAERSFSEFLVATRQAVLAAFEHQDYPFDLLVKQLQPERDPSRSPLFQVMFAFQKGDVTLKLGDLRVEPLAPDQRAAQFDLSLTVTEVDSGLETSFEYNTDLFDASTSERLSEHFRILLESVVSDSAASLCALPILSQSMRQQVLYDWNDTRTNFAPLVCVHESFSQLAASTPDQIAIVAGEEILSYRELNERANRLAHYLRARGVGPEVCVGICVPRSTAMLACVLGVLKAGGAYVPLDPAYPEERLAFMIEDSGAELVLDEQFLKTEAAAIDAASDADPAPSATVDNLAYVIYTSGSTGTPKGVMVQHGSLANYIRAANRAYEIVPQDRVLQFLPFSFDGSVEEIFISVTAGATLVLRDGEVPKAPAEFLQECVEKKITVLDLPTSYWHEVVSSDWNAASDLRLVIVGGDKALAERVEQWGRNVGPRIRLVNTYGPTEATIVATMSILDGATTGVPIGKPVANTQAHVLDQRFEPVAVGARGELYLGGANVSRGYLGDPGLTARKFIPDPFSHVPGARLYRTGDSARRRHDGQIEFLGRVDQQVKIRGHRIEPAEIEAALLRHEAVREAAVISNDLTGGGRRLAAYISLHPRHLCLKAETISSFLAGCVPKYMIPSSFTLVDALPRLPSGKIDRSALPQPDLGETDGYVAPRNTIERTVCDLWSEVLKLDRVGVYDNFFGLGGDSILSIQVSARARLAGLKISPSQIFQHPTPAELAAVASLLDASYAAEETITGEVPLTPIQRWFFEQNFAFPDHWNMALMLKLRERIDPGLLAQAFARLVQHHDALRMRFVNAPDGWRQFIAGETNRKILHVADVSHAVEIERIADETQAQLDLANGVLLQAVLFEPGEGQRLLIAAHHLVVDGVSWRILLEDLGRIYRQLQRGDEVNLPPKTTSFARWARLLHEHARSERSRSELDYWTELAATHVKPLPVDFHNGQNVEAETRTLTVALDAGETRSLLREVAQAYGTQINDVLLTALLDAFSHWTGDPALLIELESHGREDLFDDADLSRTVGWFTSAFPVLLDKRQGRKIPRHGIGYGLLRYLDDDAEVRRQMRCLPEPEVSFNYLGQLDQMLNDSELFSRSSESCGRTRHQDAQRNRLLEINAHVSEQKLQVEWNYSAAFYQQGTIEKLARNFIGALRSIIADAREPQTTIEIEARYPLSPLQQGMLFHSVYAPDSSIYIGQLSFTLEGKLDVEAFAEAWRRAIARHAVLRTSFSWEDLEEPIQAVHQRVDLPFEQLDWSQHSPVDQEQRLSALIEAERQRGFDLSAAPLMRLKLAQLDEESHVFVWTHHHLLLDGWSIAILLREIFADYENLKRGLDEQPQHSREYRDYIAWLGQQDAARAESYWRGYLEGFRAPTPLGVVHAPADPTREPDTRRLQISFSEHRTGRLNAFARQQQLTLNTLVQGAWALLLSRYSGQQDVVYGATVAGRPADFAGIEEMVGLFINTLPVRARLAAGMRVTDWLRQLQADQASSREHEHSPLVALQAQSEVPRGAPLFESLLVFENYPLDAQVLGSNENLKARDIWWFDQTNYPLTLVARPGQELSFEIFYDQHRLANDAVQRMLGHLQAILETFIANPSQRLGYVPIVSSDERAMLLSQWNDTRKESAWLDQTVHELFAAQARHTPERIALVQGAKQLTYGELNERANRLAHYLRRNGVETESRVCICLDPGIEMIVAVLAVLKAGAAYVPLDPAYPDSRLVFMLENCGARVLLTTTRLAGGRLPQGTVRAICLDAQHEEIARESPHDPAIKVSGQNLIYVIYTSGSTGRPKGAGVTHRGSVNLVNWFVSEFELTERERVLIFSSFSFDLTQKDIFAPLTVGAQLHFPTSALYDPAELLKTISKAEITLVNCTPSAFYPLVETNRPSFQDLSTLKHVFLGGEPINVSRLREWTSCSDAEIVNTYGPTETTDTCSAFRLIDFERTIAPPIGKPNDNTELLIVDEQLNLVPLGVAGELCVGGVGVGRGYLNDPSATAERFVPHPYSTMPGAQLYRTGDLARHLPDANIEFLGRLDHQVKVAGYRIELGEVEAAMVQHQAARECVVTVRADAHGNARLVAYVVPGEGGELPDTSTWRRYLADSLPSHMIPSLFVVLEKLPLTPGGKVDRRALPAPEMAGNEAGPDYVAPRTAVEEVLAGIWREVLGVERVGLHDNFLDLGGHSLLAMRCVAGVRQLFRIELPLRVLFETANLAELAQALTAYEDRPGGLEKIARVLQRVKSVSREELQNELLKRRASKARR